MRQIKMKFKDTKGREQLTPKWYLDFRDHLDIRHQIPVSEDEEETRLFGDMLRRLVVCSRHKDEQGDQLRLWTKSLDKHYREKFIAWGLLSGQIRKGVLADELEVFCSELNSKRPAMTTSRIMTAFDACGFKKWNDIDRDKIEKFLNDAMNKGIDRTTTLKDGTIKTTNSKVSQQTRKHYVRAIVQFCNWYIEKYRIDQLSPVNGLKAGTVKKLEHPRRPLTDEEITLLLNAAEKSNKVELGLTGPDRKLLYLVAVNTGLRLAELRGIRVCDFDGERIALPGEQTKNSEDAFQPLPSYVADELSQYIRDNARFAEMPLFKKVPTKGAKMLKEDLKVAEVPYKDNLGRFADFHALRHTYCRILYDAGVDVKTAQQLMRHHDIKLTLDTYAQFDLEEKKRQSMANLPTFQTKPNIKIARAV